MNELLNHYREQYRSFYQGEPWFGKSAQTIFAEISVEKAYRQTAAGGHSIVEIVLHMLAWRRLFIDRLKGISGRSIAMNSAGDWPPQPKAYTLENWNHLVHQFRQSQEELQALIDGLSPENLHQPLADTQQPLIDHLAGNLQHDIYHLGQAGLLKNL